MYRTTNEEHEDISLSTYLGYVAETIAKIGWISRGTVSSDATRSTAAIALSAMEHDIDRNTEVIFTEETYELVKEARQWAKDSDAKNDYMRSVQSLAGMKYISVEHTWYAASMINSYLSFRGKKTTKSQITSNIFFGKIGDKAKNIEVTCTDAENIIRLPDPIHINKMSVKGTGETLIWWSKYFLVVGHEYKIDFKIKDHKIYKDVFQTIITQPEVFAKINFVELGAPPNAH